MSIQVLLPIFVVLSLATLMICRRRLGLHATVTVGLLFLGAFCLTAIIYPWTGPLATFWLLAFMSLSGICVAVIPTQMVSGIYDHAQSLRPRLVNCGLLTYTLLILLGGAELIARSFSSPDVFSRTQPLITVLVDGTEDYRGYHMVGDPYHVPDPDLGWAPCDGPPFNKQKMRGPIIEVPKPKDVVRVLSYGDSNTEGSCDYRSWSEELHVALQNARSSDGRRYEVANAGVAGYSSHQGLRRFLKDVDLYQPDVVFTSFGWNDFAKTDRPDKAYQPPNRAVLATKRFLFEYQFFVALLDQLSAPLDKVALAEESESLKLPRVSLEEYVENLQSFAEVSHERGIRLILLTRPHQNRDGCTEDFMKKWLQQAEQYNQEMVTFASNHGIEHVDVESFFSTRQDAFIDACHFSSPGNRVMASLLKDHLLAPNLMGDQQMVAIAE